MAEQRTVNVFQTVAVEKQSPFDMGKLADKFRHRNTGWTIPEAFLGLMFSAAMADGNFDPNERDTILAIAKRSRALSSLAPQDLAAANEAVNERLANRPMALEECCQTLPADMCLPVFAHCVDIILSDGQLVQPEAQFLDKLVPLLDIGQENARRVMEVLLLKAQY
ncbi:MAG: TerB family tellurite resistance protein [Pseudomonadota bacterium]